MNRLSRWSMAVTALSFASGAIAAPPLNFYQQRNLVSDIRILARRVDPNLVNAWGLQFNPSGLWWVADNGTGVSTLYNAQGVANSLVVGVPAGAAATPLAHPDVMGVVALLGLCAAGGVVYLALGALLGVVNLAELRFLVRREPGVTPVDPGEPP